MYNIHDIKKIYNQNAFIFKMQCERGTKNINFKGTNQHKNDTCHG